MTAASASCLKMRVLMCVAPFVPAPVGPLQAIMNFTAIPGVRLIQTTVLGIPRGIFTLLCRYVKSQSQVTCSRAGAPRKYKAAAACQRMPTMTEITQEAVLLMDANVNSTTRVEQLLVNKGRQVHTITPDSSVLQALELMAEHNVGALAVTEKGRLVGMISERDYARKVILKGRASRDTPVGESMTANVITV